MGSPGFSVIPEYLVDYSKTLEAVAQATTDAASTADSTGFGGIPVYGLLPSAIVLPLLELSNGSTADAIRSAAQLGQRAVTSMAATAAAYSAAEAALLAMLLQTEASTVDGDAKALPSPTDRPLYSDGGGNLDDVGQFGTDIYGSTQGGTAGLDAGEVTTDALGIGMDALGAYVDPWGALWAIGVGWIIEQVPFLRVPVDDLLGQPEAIKAVAMTWSNIGGWLKQMPAELQTALPLLVSWQGDTATMFRQLEGQFEMALAGLGEQCVQLAGLITYLGTVVATIRSLGISIISDFVAWSVATMVSALAISDLTFGASLGAAGLAEAIEGEVTGVKLALIIGQLTVKLAQAGVAAEALRTNSDMAAAMLHQVISSASTA